MSAGSSGATGTRGTGGEGSGTSTPSKTSGSSVLSANLSAHLQRSAVPSSPIVDSTSLHASPHSLRLPGQVQQNGKAPATAADTDSIADSEVWKSSAARRAEKAWAIQSERTLQSDAKFKKYAAAIEKCLSTFESVSEWADFIAFLARLLKTLQTSPQFNAIPQKLIVAKRLSQCLNPALPSGVHQRVLEVYEHIFSVIGPEGLRRDLSVWSPGLLPFFQFASTTVKPIVLALLENHFLPLGQDLRPIAKPLQLALLPGLEEEAGEHFERVLSLLDKVKFSIGEAYFYQNLWLLLISMTTTRLPALHYLARRLPNLNGERFTSSMEVSNILGPDIGLTVRAFCAVLEDDSLLALRAALDLLVAKFRLDSFSFKTLVRSEDKIRLLQSALSVVLRRDISLNRRLYAWLLSPSEEAAVQQAYFEKHALEWARLALLSEFSADANADREAYDMQFQVSKTDRQRPYRILISLLDKWSLGLPMTSAIIIDTFHALRRHMEATNDGPASSDISTTAKMLFEAVDPFAMYRKFFHAIYEELRSDQDAHENVSVISLLRFIFSSFRVHDEESKVVHLPTLFGAVVELVAQRPQSDQATSALILARDMLVLIPKRVFSERSESSSIKTKTFVEHGAYLYETASSGVDEAAKRYVGFQHPQTVAELLTICSTISIRNPSSMVESLTIFCQLLNLLDATMEPNTEQARIRWQGDVWSEQMGSMLQHTHTFIELEACVETFVAVSQCRALETRIPLQRNDTTTTILNKLLAFMQPSTSPYHVRSVELLWTVVDLTASTSIGATLCRQIASGSQQERSDGLETFGILWKFSEESRLSHRLLSDPLLCILDGLRSDNWYETQSSENWVRNHARNFIAMLDPLILMLRDDNCARTPRLQSLEGLDLHFFTYTRPLDHERVRFALSLLLRLFHIGGTALMRSMRSSRVSQSAHSRLATTATGKEHSYTDLLLETLVDLLKSDPPESSAYRTQYDAVHALVVDLLNLMTTKGQVSVEQLSELENVLLGRLWIDIASGTLQVQSRYLQTLHSIMNSHQQRASSTTAKLVGPQPPSILLHIIRAGLSAPSNRPILQQWTDFILSIAPTFRTALSPLLLPLNQGLCALIRAGIADIQQAYDGVQGETVCSTSDSDIVMLMAMSEKILLQSLEVQTQAEQISDGGQGKGEKEETFSFMGALSNVFSTEPASMDGGSGTSSNAVWKSLHQTVMTLHLAWQSTSATALLDDSRQDTLDVVRQTVQLRCRRYLERLYRNHSGEVVEALIACWHVSAQKSNEFGSDSAFAILSFLAPSAQIVVTFLCNIISTRISDPLSSEKSPTSAPSTTGKGVSGNKHMNSPGVPESVLLAFMEAYLARLDANATILVWPVVALFVKDILQHSTQHKAQIFPTLRCLTVMAQKTMEEKKSADERRLKREMTDYYVRTCDLSILLAGRSFEQTTWIGRRTVTLDVDQDEGSASRDEKMSASASDLATSTAGLPFGVSGSVEAIQLYLAESVLPLLKTFSIDADKLNGLAGNVVYYVITPALKPKRKRAEVSSAIVKLLVALAQLPGTIKVWRTAVTEFFQDNRFFDVHLEAGEQWMPIIYSLMNNEKERFVETIGRISTPSTNIFTNREAETAMRVLNVRRMSYVIFSGPKDHWLTQLPLIQEKLVDLLRNSAADPAIGEVYLCLRVLLIRFDSRHLSGFWPVVITEMMRLFESALDELPADNSDALLLLDSACRFLDLLVTLQTDEFQIHQWLFITDNVDVVYPPDDWIPESILDRLATAIGERKSVTGTAKTASQRRDPARMHSRERGKRETDETAAAKQDRGLLRATLLVPSTKRKPLLSEQSALPVSRIESLQPFFANISLHAFESTYASGAQVDIATIERQIGLAFFVESETEI